MVIGVLTVELLIPMCQSLKEKRRVLNALKSRLSSSFNISVAEVGDEDKWQKSVVAVVHVGVTKPVVNSCLSHLLTALEHLSNLQVINYEMELIV